MPESLPRQQFDTTDQKPRDTAREQLFDHAFAVQTFEPGEQLPVGGTNTFDKTTLDIGVILDTEPFQDFFTSIDTRAQGYKREQLKAWLEQNKATVSTELFAALQAFTSRYREQYPDTIPDKSEQRSQRYHDNPTQTKLSDVVMANLAQCAEIAALAKLYLQQSGITAEYVSGDALWNKTDEFSEEHSFLVVTDGEQQLIYDPTNPTRGGDWTYPSLYQTEANLNQSIRQGKKQFVTSHNLLTKQETYFGVSNGTNVDPERDII